MSKARYVHSMQHFNPIGSLSSTYLIKNIVNTYIYTDRLHIHRYKYINEILIFFVGWLGCNQDGGRTKHPRVSGREQVYGPLTLRFIRKGNEVPRVLIHLFSLTFRRHTSQLWVNSVAMTAMSDSSCVPQLKCSATGDSSVLRSAMSYRWPLILIWSGWPISPTYWSYIFVEGL